MGDPRILRMSSSFRVFGVCLVLKGFEQEVQDTGLAVDAPAEDLDFIADLHLVGAGSSD